MTFDNVGAGRRLLQAPGCVRDHSQTAKSTGRAPVAAERRKTMSVHGRTRKLAGEVGIRSAKAANEQPHDAPIARSTMTAVKYRTAAVDGVKIFFREAGAANARNLLLLHGFPSAGHMFRDLIP